MQAYQCLCCLLIIQLIDIVSGLYDMGFRSMAALWLRSMVLYLVGSPEDGFFCDESHIISDSYDLIVYLWYLFLCSLNEHVYMYILRASWKISYFICIFVCAKCCHPQKIKSLLTYLLNLKRPLKRRQKKQFSRPIIT